MLHAIMSRFVHLHVHSHYSLLDGLPKIEELVRHAKEQDFESLALTDHGVLYGALEFYKKAKAAGIKPIIGMEAYVAPRSMLDKEGKIDQDYWHLLLLAKNEEGYRNLLKLSSIAHIKGYYYKPRIDKEVLRAHAGGLIALSGCQRGEVARTVLSSTDRAMHAIREYQSILGQDSFFLELQRTFHEYPQEHEQEERLNKLLVELGRKAQAPLVATNDAHYLLPDDREAQDVLVCIQTGRQVGETGRLDMRRAKLHLATDEEMQQRFSDIPEAILHTVRVAEMCNLELPLGKRFFPQVTLPSSNSPEEELRKLAEGGLREKLHAGHVSKEVEERLAYELYIICEKGYASYFLVVADIMRWARQQGIVTATRGSVAGSLVAYALGITTTNPLSFELPFERFLTLERPVPPDIDMDFADDRRGEVLRYVTEKYGSDKVAQIITFGTMMARAAIRDIGRALGVAYSKCDRLAKMIPLGRFGFHTTINDALRISKEFHQAYEQDGESKRIIDLAKKLEGVVRHASVHAAGVVIAPTPLVDYVPLQLDTESKNVITQYDMHAVEEAGLVKMDFLGIRYLAILGNAVEIIKHTRGTTVDLAQIPLDDEKTYALLTEGRTMGVFQLGGAGMTRYLVLLKPSNIFDIMAMVALFRPGPMEFIPEYIRRKHDSSLIEYLDPRLEELLTRSYGVITYQDDVLLIAVKIAGYTWEEADKLRKAMGKKIPSEMREQKEKFIAGCMQNGIMETRAHELWRRIEPFAAYGFNKAHAASYAMVAYQTAYLKANFPVEFMAALMTAEAGDLETVALAVEECKELGIQVLPPDVNESLDSFTVIDNMTIRFGLAAIKHLSSEVTKAVIEEREAHGVFRDLADLASRMPIRTFNKKSWEALVKCGALDRFGERNSLLANTEEILGYIRLQQKARTSGQEALFGIEGAPLRLREVPPAPQNEKLAWEKEYLGLYVSAHPLDQHAETLKQYAKPIRDLTELNDGAPCIVGGLFSRTQRILTKNGEQMAFCTLEDTTGSVEVLVFPKIYQQIKDRLLPERITLVRGRITTRDNELKIIADEVKGLPAKNNRPS